jgi:hypothetical protein
MLITSATACANASLCSARNASNAQLGQTGLMGSQPSTPERVCPVILAAQPHAVHPLINKPSILASAERARMINANGADVIAQCAATPLQPSEEACASVWHQPEQNGLTCFCLNDDRAGTDLSTSTRSPILILTTSQPRSMLSMPSQQYSVTQASMLVEEETDRPDLPRLQRALGINLPPSVPRMALARDRVEL